MIVFRVADEVLYQTLIHPEQSYVTVEEARTILEKLQEILRTAVSCLNADLAYPETWLFGHRWTKKASSKDFHKQRIQFVTVGGRTSAIIASQKLYKRSALEKHSDLEKSSAKTQPPKEPAATKKATTTKKAPKQTTKKRSSEDLQQYKRRSPRLAL